MSIYVEVFIAGSMEDVLHRTQEPHQHERWDLRFTDIDYLPRIDEDAPQRFLYKTRIGFGLEIAGVGETTKEHARDGSVVSALRFHSDDRKSLIRAGAGYWKYEQHEGGVRFLTRYDYQTRFGAAGRLFDRLIFRPLLGWATAWSFDRLRLWIERGIDPAVSMRDSLVHAVARLTLAFVFLYHGLVPKLIVAHPDELALMSAVGLPPLLTVHVLGILEILAGVFLLVMWRHRLVLMLIPPAMIVMLIGVALTAPAYITAAFNPVTLNIATAALSAIAYLASAHLPSAKNCLRKEPEK